MRTILFHLLLLAISVTDSHSQPMPPHLRIGANPNIWFAQPSVIIGEGWDREAGFVLEQKVYPGPAHNLQAFVAGELDGVNNNVAAALLAHDRGKKLKLVAATFAGDISIIVQPEVGPTPSTGGLAQLKGFRAAHGRRFKLATNPRGSLSDLTVRRWLDSAWPEYESDLELISAGDQAQLQQLFLSKSADGCAGFGSLLWLFQEKITATTELIPPDQLMRDQPGGALMMSEEFTIRHPEQVAALAKLYRRASELIRRDPARAAEHIDKYLTSGFVPRGLLEASLKARREFVISDLEPMRRPIEALAVYMHEKGYLKRLPTIDSLLLPVASHE